MSTKTRYSDAELEEFRAIIQEKLDKAYRDYDLLTVMIQVILLLRSKYWKKVRRHYRKKKPVS